MLQPPHIISCYIRVHWKGAHKESKTFASVAFFPIMSSISFNALFASSFPIFFLCNSNPSRPMPSPIVKRSRDAAKRTENMEHLITIYAFVLFDEGIRIDSGGRNGNMAICSHFTLICRSQWIVNKLAPERNHRRR